MAKKRRASRKPRSKESKERGYRSKKPHMQRSGWRTVIELLLPTIHLIDLFIFIYYHL